MKKSFLFVPFVMLLLGWLTLIRWNLLSFNPINLSYHPPEFLLVEPWKQYTDPNGYFSISIPSSWPVDTSPYEWHTVYGGNPSPFNYQESKVFLGYPRGNRETDIKNEFISFVVFIDKPAQSCLKNIKKSFNNLPTEDGFNFFTNIAEYHIEYEYPGKEHLLPHPDTYVRYKITPQFMEANQKVIDRVIRSFKIHNQKPLYCNK